MCFTFKDVLRILWIMSLIKSGQLKGASLSKIFQNVINYFSFKKFHRLVACSHEQLSDFFAISSIFIRTLQCNDFTKFSTFIFIPALSISASKYFLNFQIWKSKLIKHHPYCPGKFIFFPKLKKGKLGENLKDDEYMLQMNDERPRLFASVHLPFAHRLPVTNRGNLLWRVVFPHRWWFLFLFSYFWNY